MFEKIVVVDSTGLNTWGVERLKELGKEVVFYTGIPETDEEIVNRIGDVRWFFIECLAFRLYGVRECR